MGHAVVGTVILQADALLIKLSSQLVRKVDDEVPIIMSDGECQCVLYVPAKETCVVRTVKESTCCATQAIT